MSSLTISCLLLAAAQADCLVKEEYVAGVERDMDRTQRETMQRIPSTDLEQALATMGKNLNCLSDRYTRYLRERAAYLRECYTEAGKNQAQGEEEALSLEAQADQFTGRNCR